MVTKKRKEKEAEKAAENAAQEAAWAEISKNLGGKLPAYIQDAIDKGELVDTLSNESQYQPTKTEKLRGGLREADETGENWIASDRIGKGSREKHTLEKAKVLKRRYQSIWKQKSSAKEITYQEQLGGRQISTRTIQRYQKLLP